MTSDSTVIHGAAAAATDARPRPANTAEPEEGLADAAPQPLDPVQAGALLRRLFAEHGAFVLRTVRHFGVATAELEDATQEVFVVAHRRLDQLDPDIDPRAWLYGIARRVAAAQRRRAYVRHEQPHEDPAGRVGDPARQDASVELGQRRAVLAQALDLLDEDKRAVFVLYELEGLTMPEIVQIEGCPLQTAYSRLRAAREIVQQFVDQWMSGERKQ